MDRGKETKKPGSGNEQSRSRLDLKPQTDREKVRKLKAKSRKKKPS